MVTRAQFSNYFQSVPECAGMDDYPFRVFLVPNELDCDKTLEVLQTTPVRGNTIISTSTFFVLDMASVRGDLVLSSKQTDYLILLDCGTRVEHFWQKMVPIIQSASSRLEVIEKTKELLIREKGRYYSGSQYRTAETLVDHYSRWFDESINKSESWLSSDERFERIKKIFDLGHFVFKRVDLYDPSALEVLSKVLKERNLTVDSIYLSNVMEYCELHQREPYFQALAKIISSTTLVIQSVPRSCDHCYPLEQRVIAFKEGITVNAEVVSGLFDPQLEKECKTCEERARQMADKMVI